MIYKLCSLVINRRMCHNVGWHDGVHVFREGRGCTAAIMESKLLAEKAKSAGKILYQVFLDLSKAYDTVDWDRLFILLQDYGLGPPCRAVLQGTWMDCVLVPKKGGQYGKPVPTGHGVRQGDVISPMLFNILVDAILRHEELQCNISGISDISPRVCFYADDVAISGTDAPTIQQSLDAIIDGFKRLGICVNREKTKWMFVARKTQINCIQHRAYCNLVRGGPETYVHRGHQLIKCPVCATNIQWHCLQHHLLHQHPESVGFRKINFFSPTLQ